MSSVTLTQRQQARYRPLLPRISLLEHGGDPRLPYRSTIVFVVAGLAALSGACAGPPVPSAIEGEPVCPDYEVGATRTKLQGSLRFPVTVTVRDGSTLVTTKLILGSRTPNDPPTRILLIDSNEEYTIEWAQCENELATKPVGEVRAKKERTDRYKLDEARVDEHGRWGIRYTKIAEVMRYECGAASVYSSEKLTTKKGDRSTRAVKFVAPPRPECRMSDVPASPARDAGPDDATKDEKGRSQ